MAAPRPFGHPLFLAEAGCNHNGDLDLALELLRVGARSGADVVKFQAFQTELLVTEDCPAAAYQQAKSQKELLAALELSQGDFQILADEARKLGIAFLATPFDEPSLELVNGLEVPFHKVSSGEIDNLPFLERIAACGRPVVLSTGTASLGEVAAAVRAVQKGAALAERRAGRWEGPLAEGLILLHCVTQYPAPDEASNLRAMQTMQRAFGLPVGYSDHTLGLPIPSAAVALGAVCIEKHFTLDRNMPGPDHMASIEPEGLRELISSCRRIAVALGDGVKRPAACELDNRKVVRKSLVASKDLAAGTVLGAAHLHASRPQQGIPAAQWPEVEGRSLRRDLRRGSHLHWEDLGG